jgi:hypothetical protein
MQMFASRQSLFGDLQLTRIPTCTHNSSLAAFLKDVRIALKEIADPALQQCRLHFCNASILF